MRRRQAFEEATAIVGAGLLCLKKAKNFQDWSCKPGTMPYVLLTDWREVKQCMVTLQGLRPQKRPVFTVVTVETGKQYLRATDWAQQLPRDTTDPVYVCQDDDLPHTLVSGLSAQLVYLLKKHAMHTWLSLSVDRDAWPPMQAFEASDQEGPEEARRTWETWRAGDFRDFSSAPPQGEQLPPVQPTLNLPQEVDRVMQAVWEKCASPVHAKQLLLDAMPERYED